MKVDRDSAIVRLVGPVWQHGDQLRAAINVRLGGSGSTATNCMCTQRD
jgi:hypothetical protein